MIGDLPIETMEKAHRYSGVRLHLIFILLFVVMQKYLPDWVNALFWIMYRMLGSVVHICRFASIDVSRHYIIPFGYIGTMFRDINDYCKVPFWFFFCWYYYFGLQCFCNGWLVTSLRMLGEEAIKHKALELGSKCCFDSWSWDLLEMVTCEASDMG